MRALAAFIMRSHSNAIMVAVVGSLLGLIFPPLVYPAAAAIALVMLRDGPRPALGTVLGAFASIAILSWLIFQSPYPSLFFLLSLWVPVVLVAWVLRSTISAPLALESAAVFGVVLLIGIYVFVGDPVAAWRDVLESVVKPALEQAQVNADQARIGVMLDRAAELMSGVVSASLALSIILTILLARWWQALLYNPGGFREEFHALRLHRATAVVAIIIFLVAGLMPGTLGGLAANLSLTVLILFLFQGLATVHGSVAAAGASMGWLIGLYVLMLLLLPQVVMLLAAVGVADTWVDFRSRVSRKT